jgi:hypothetical protein
MESGELALHALLIAAFVSITVPEHDFSDARGAVSCAAGQ